MASSATRWLRENLISPEVRANGIQQEDKTL
jgi:hypothetical protein